MRKSRRQIEAERRVKLVEKIADSSDTMMTIEKHPDIPMVVLRIYDYEGNLIPEADIVCPPLVAVEMAKRLTRIADECSAELQP